jgi:hypothetical protein
MNDTTRTSTTHGAPANSNNREGAYTMKHNQQPTHRVTTVDADRLLQLYHDNHRKPGAVIIIDNPRVGIESYYMTSAPNMAGRMAGITTDTNPLDIEHDAEKLAEELNAIFDQNTETADIPRAARIENMQHDAHAAAVWIDELLTKPNDEYGQPLTARLTGTDAKRQARMTAAIQSETMHSAPGASYIPATSTRAGQDPLNGTPALITTYYIPAGVCNDAQQAVHYVDERADFRPTSTRRRYVVAEPAPHCYRITRYSTMTPCELYKHREAAQLEALQDEADRSTPPDEDTPRNEETRNTILELGNVELLYNEARILMKRRINQRQNQTRQQTKAEAAREYVETIATNYTTRTPYEALLVSLALAAVDRVDWEDVAHDIGEGV